ncbi:MAG: carbonic anhydrase [Deltaproteobacteria bacterium]|jgi:carbonic anhydrase|nr:carbonic anhydrase [Deltaproteobacteria bacterium]
MPHFPHFNPNLFPRLARWGAVFIAVLAVSFLSLTVSALAQYHSSDQSSAVSHGSNNPNSVDSALKALKEGNARFVAGQSTNPRQNKEFLAQLVINGQTPLAAVLSCSDSRSPVEKIFDLGFGDLFVVRAGGATPGVDQIGSLEYAVDHLGVPVIVVLTHTYCGAIAAALSETKSTGALGEMLAKLNPVAKAVEELDSSKRLDAAIKMSAVLFREQLSLVSPVIADAVKTGRLKVISGVHDLDTGVVSFHE